MFIVPTPFRENESTDGMAKTWNPSHRSDHIFVTTIRNPLPEIKSINEGVGRNGRAFRLARTESIPLAILNAKCPLLSGSPRTPPTPSRAPGSRNAVDKWHPKKWPAAKKRAILRTKTNGPREA